uniref:Uncharacterized protein n=1 Tax=Lepeophtheirus salmonis TaxID=72036 RepID=A0A0K2U238_LEPSM
MNVCAERQSWFIRSQLIIFISPS